MSKQYVIRAHVLAHMLKAIREGAEAYGETAPTDAAAWVFFARCLKNEYGWCLKQKPPAEAIAEYLQGLPTCCTVAFSNFDIIAKGRACGALSPDASERGIEGWLNSWFNRCGMVAANELRRIGAL